MFKVLSIIFLLGFYCGGQVTTADQNTILDYQRYHIKESVQWQDHIKDFIKLINVEKILNTIDQFIDDPEVMRFLEFLLSPIFKDMVWEMENLDEFKEAYVFLLCKGYDLKSVIDTVNNYLSLPPFTEPAPIMKNNKGVSEFISAMIRALPIEEMKELLKNKIKNNPEVAEFIHSINSEEFKNIMKRMISSPKFDEFKSTFERYGVDFKFVCLIFIEIFGEAYPNITCDNVQSNIL